MNAMRKRTAWVGLALTFVFVVAARPAGVQAADTSVDAELALARVEGPAAEPVGGTALGYIRPMPENPVYARKVAYPDGRIETIYGASSDRAGGPPYEKVIYSNTRGSSIWVPGTVGLNAADDWATISIDGCAMTSFSLAVNGGGDGEDEFIAVVSLYDGCPGQGGELIDGTFTIFTGLDDDFFLMWELTVNFDPPLEVPPTVWARIAFSSTTAGWVFDKAPELGFSADAFWLPIVGQNSCDVYFGGSPPHASFWGELTVADGVCSGFSQEQCSTALEDCPTGETCEGGCPTHFLAYSAAVAAGDRYSPPSSGDPTRVGDDFTLTVTDCELSSYELGVRAFGGPFTIEIDLRPNGLPDPYPGTERTLTGIGDGRLEIMRATFPEGGIFIDQYAAMTWKPSRSSVSAINARRTLAVGPVEAFYPPPPNEVDTPGQYFWLLDAPNFPGWVRFDSLFGEPAIFYIVINCKGTPPTGACCPAQQPGGGVNCFDDTTVLECLGSRWLRDVRCEDNPFNPPCGTHACCTPDDDCSNLFFEECDVICVTVEGEERCGIWGSGTFCSRNGQFCPLFVCTFATGDCLSETPCAFLDCECTSDEQCQDEFGLGPRSKCVTIDGGFRVCTPRVGCGNIACCHTVCVEDFFCCETAWGPACADLAASLSDTACKIKPGNDECASDFVPNVGWDEGTGATAISIVAGVGEATVALGGASIGSDDPPLCCNNLGLDRQARNTRWYTFIMPAGETSAKIHTCFTGGSFDASNSLLQVFEIADTSAGICADGSACSYGGEPGQCPDGECLVDEETVCQELVAFACNDDTDGCGFSDQNSSLCIDGLEPGDTYYIMIGASTSADFGTYSLRVEVPCATVGQLPPNNACDNAILAVEGTTPFNLNDATFQCPGEECALALKNDVWFIYTADCVGLLSVETCDANPARSDPATTLAVYVATVDSPPVANCPPSTDPIACNDDAEVGEFHLQFRPQACGVSGLACVTDVDCGGFCSQTGLECGTNADCNQCANFRHCTETNGQCVDDSWCDLEDPNDVCEGTTAPCITSVDCRWCSQSHERCRDFKHCSLTGAICTGDVNDNDCALVGETCEKDCQLRICSLSATACELDGDCPQGETCGDEVCIASNSCIITGQTCIPEVCESSCEAGSALLAPVFNGQLLLIRVGGEFGGEPRGDLTIECIHADCNFNGIPDALDILAGISTDCNQNLRPDECDIAFASSIDCDLDGLPDECQIDAESNGNITCERCSISGAACFEDADCGDDGGTCSVTVPSNECNEGLFYCFFGCDPDVDLNGIPDACGSCGVNYVSSVPDASDVGEDAIRPEGTLWRTEGNVIRITLDGAAENPPNAGDVEIRELQDGGAFGPDLSATFDFSMEDGNTVLRIKDQASTIEHQKWYAIINVSWAGVCEFERHYASAYGDGSGDGLVQFADLAFINSEINQPPASPDADRHDINGDNLIQFADLAAANATINLHAIPKPTGH